MDRILGGLKRGARRGAKRGSQVESLEPRMVLAAANLVISEFLASNSGGLRDQDGQTSDWMEIYNADSTPVVLDNWFLSDNQVVPDKWAFPATTIQPGEYLVVFASGKDRAVAGGELHTNFALSNGGEYLGLSYNDPVDGLEVVHEFNPSFEPQTTNVSHGFDQPFNTTSLIGPTASVEVLVPSVANGGSTLGNTWTQSGFTPTGWTDGTNGVGWEDGTDYASLIGTDVKSEMDGENASAFVRIPFDGVDPQTVSQLDLSLNYDDGYIAYLNGTEIARRNAPASATWNSNATAEHGGILEQFSYPTFENLNGLTVNSNNSTYAPIVTGGRLRVTPTQGNLGNSVFRSNTVAFDPAHYSFSTNMVIEVHTPGGSNDGDGLGADGMTFALQNAGAGRVGTAGGGIGLDGITPFVAVEFDTWQSGSWDPDTSLPTHIGIDTSLAGSVARVAVPRFNDGGLRYVWIDYDGVTNTMDVYFTTTSTKPATPTLSAMVDLNTIFGGANGLYAGFTAGTGGATNTHDVVSWDFTSGSGDLGAAAQSIDLTPYKNLLSPTSNVLAIHGMNRSASDDVPGSLSDRDFLIRPQLTVTTVDPINTTLGRYFTTPTPGFPNGIGTAAPSRATQYSRDSGTFVAPFQLTISSLDPTAQIRYTTNGTIPTVASTLYTAPITITNSTQIRSVAIEPGKAASAPVSRNFIALDATVANFQSNLPIVILDSYRGVSLNAVNLTAVGASFIDVGADGIARITDPADFAGLGGLRYRGQTSQGFPKPHFAYEAWDESGSWQVNGGDQNVSIFGFAEDSDWVLNNPYSEKPLMQNYLSYKWFDETGEYAIKTQFVEVFANLNGDPNLRYDLTTTNLGNATRNDYLGVYLFMEKIKIDDNRVNVDQLDPTQNSEPEVTGGYIYKRDKASEAGVPEVVFTSSRGIQYRVHDPDVSDMTSAQQSYLTGFVNEMESVIYGANFNDPIDGYAKYIDVDSWIDHWILVEMTKNIDGFRLSTYYTKERDKVDPASGEVIEPGKVIMGPVWDYNLSLGNAYYNLGDQPAGWYHSQSTTLNATSGLGEADYIYFRRLFQDPNFKQKLVDRWQELRESVFSNENILKDVNDTIALLTNGNPNPVATNDPNLWTDPITRNYSRWRVIGVNLWPNSFVGNTWMQDVAWMRDTFLMPRLAWIDSQWLAKPLANQDGGLVPDGFQVTLAGPAGTPVYYTLDGTDPRTGGDVIPGQPGSTILAGNAPVKWFVPTDNALGTTWASRTFDDTGWGSGTGGIGYERDTGYEGVLGTDINTEMTAATTFFSRFHFNVDNPAAVNLLYLDMQYDDGFVTYLNGTEVARSATAPAGVVAFNATATNYPDNLTPERFNLTAVRNLLVAGDNVLAIHGLNQALTSSDLLIRPEIRINGTPDTIIPAGLSPSAIQYIGPITIDQNTRVTARSYVSATGNFSGPFEATFVTQTIPLVVTEINYNPANPSAAEIAAGFADNDDFEFIELRNVGTTPLDLGGMSIVDGVTFTFPASPLPAGERVLVVKNPAAFALRYGLGHNIAGTFTGNLANEGEHIQVLGPVGELTMDFTFSDAWHPLTDGGGSSLVIVNDAAAPSTWNLAESWRPSDYTGGSPGSGDAGIAPAPDSLRINELLLDTAGPTGQRIELYNASSAPIDVSGFYLSDNLANLTKYRLPLGLSPILAGGYLVLDGATTFGAALPLSLGGGELLLRSADAGGLITGFETSEIFTATAPEVSQGWYIKSTGRHDFTPLVSPTLGAANSGPSFGPVVINELMYQPPVVGDEFIELYNTSGAPVSLENWSFSSGVDFTFAATTLGASEYLLVVGIAPATFRTKYSIPASVQIVGPYAGSLADNGENVELARPNATGGAVRVDRVNYNTDSLWPVRPQGIGSSLSRVDASAYGNDVTNWGSDLTGGSPGSANSIFDDTPPTVPTGLGATVAPGNQVMLSWSPSSDPQTSVAHYNIYRNNVLLDTTTSTSYVDTIADTSVTYVYDISAVNPSSQTSNRSAQASARVLVLGSATPTGSTTVSVNFNSVVTTASAQNLANYVIPGLNVTGATLQPGGTSVVLTTSPQTDGQPYRVVVNGVVSTAGALIQPNGTAIFAPGAGPGLLGQYFNDPATIGQPNNDSLLPANLVTTRTDANISFTTWGTGSPIPGTVHTDYFSVRWTGKLRSLGAGTYSFGTIANDGIRLWIWPEGQPRPAPLIDKWTNTIVFTIGSATVPLAADTSYNFMVEYYDANGSAQAIVQWSPGDGSSLVPIPASQFSLAVDLEMTPPQVSEVLVASSRWTPAFLGQLQSQGLGNGGVTIPLGGTSSVLPWSNLNQVKVRFDSDVNVAANDLTIAGVSVASYGVESFVYDYASLTATWTLSQPIAFDRADISVSSGVTDLAFNSVTGPLTSGVRVATGDVNGDGSVNSADRASELAHQFTSIGHANYLASHDVTGDGVINLSDMVLLQQRFNTSLPAPSPAAAAAVLVHRVTADAEQSTEAQPLRIARRASAAVAQRRLAAIDRAIDLSNEDSTQTSNRLAASRARRVVRHSAVDIALSTETNLL
ncbi:MAG: lamin tail domain-containing protein [Pirellulales bacterium]